MFVPDVKKNTKQNYYSMRIFVIDRFYDQKTMNSQNLKPFKQSFKIDTAFKPLETFNKQIRNTNYSGRSIYANSITSMNFEVG